MREIQFPIISLGSEKPVAPDTKTLVLWIKQHIGKTADLTTWEIEATLSAQKAVSQPCAAGTFYNARILHAFKITDGKLENEFGTDFDEVAADITAAQKIIKHTWWSMPVQPAEKDVYFRNEDTFAEEYAAAINRLCRFMRDKGIDGHVLCGNANEMMLESCKGRKYLWKCGTGDYEKLLEGGVTSLVCNPEDTELVCNLNDSYDIRKILVRDANRDAMETLLETFDAKMLYVAGFAPGTEQETYFETLTGVKARLIDI